MATGLSRTLLSAMLKRIGEKQATTHPMRVTSQSFDDLLESSAELNDERSRFRCINRHLDYLEQEGFITIREKGRAFQRSWIELTSNGYKFLQPELVEFGKEPLLPQVVKSIEDRIEVLTYPQEEKDSMRYRLREALTKQAPDFFAKVLVEIASKVFTGK